jgi:hypothetical protein
MTQPNASANANLRRSRLLTAGAVGLAIIVALVVWLIVKGGGDNSKSTGPPPATAATVSTLRGLPAQLGHPVFWAGPRGGYTYELTQVNGNVFVRYLPSGTPVGDRRPNYLTVGTYPRSRSYTVLRRQATRSGSRSQAIARNGIAVWSTSRPQSVYVAYPGSDVQIEVYDPSAARARHLATSGGIRPL